MVTAVFLKGLGTEKVDLLWMEEGDWYWMEKEKCVGNGAHYMLFP